ncbi:hypothetical protein ABPG74_019189 [Tetrahymena malaccensis]
MSNENLSQHQNFNQKDFDDILIREITIKKSSLKFVKQFLKNLQQSNQCIYEVCENTKKQIILNEKRDLQQVNQENHEKNTKKAQENQIKILHDEVIQQQNDQLNVLNYHIKKQPDNQQQQKDFIFNEQIQATLVQKEQVNISNENINYSKNFNQKDFDDILIREITIKKSSWKYVKQFLKNLQQPNQCIHEVSQNSKKYAIFNENKDLQQVIQQNNQINNKQSKENEIQKSHVEIIDKQNDQLNVQNYQIQKQLDNQQQQEEINISASLVQGQHKDILKNTDEMHKNIRKTTHCTFQDNQSSKYTKNSHIKCSDLESKIIFTKEEWNIQIFEELNINSHLSQNFKNNQDQIFQELQKKRYYLLNKLNLSQNEEVFEGYQPSEQISSNGVCSLYYFVVIHDLNEKDFNQKMQKIVQLKVNNINFLVDQIEVTQSTKILVLQRQYEFYVDNQVIDFLPQDFRVCWNNNDYELLDILGHLFYNLREYENSLKFYNQSLEIKQKMYSKFSIEIAFTLSNIGLESLEMAKQVFRNNNPELIDFYLQVGDIKRYLSENYVQIYHLKALELARKKYNQSFEYIDYKQGELSLQYFLESLEEFKTLFKESNIKIASNLFQIGKVYFQQLDFKNALKYFLEYRDMRQQLNYIQYDDDDYYFESLKLIVECYQFINDPILAYKASLENFQLSKKYNRNTFEVEESLNLFVKNCNCIENYNQALVFRIENLQKNNKYNENLLRIGVLYELIGDFTISIDNTLKKLCKDQITDSTLSFQSR